ncbi:MAG TPA: SLC13 family permease [Vicinamibacterales bacterium]
MTADQLTVFGVLAATLALFMWNRWRYDIVAVLALLVLALAGIVPPADMFAGLGHPAVVTVAAVLVLSRGLLHAGVVDTLASRIMRVGNRPWLQVATLTTIVALSSGFMNNVGALALFMPVAIWMSRQSGRSPSLLLMPLAFGSLLGGMLTLIGTPPNIIIAAYRAETGAPPFQMFDFLPVGGGIALGGLLFISIAGWRLTPQRAPEAADDLFEISAYLTEVRVPAQNRFVGRTLFELLDTVRTDAEVLAVGLVRDEQQQELPSTYEILREGDIVLVESDSDSLKVLLDKTGLVLAEGTDEEGRRRRQTSRDLSLAEVIVTPDSMLVGRTATLLDLRMRYGVNVLAVARHGHRLRQRLGSIRFAAGDILLVQAGEKAMHAVVNELGCLPLASRGLRIGRPRKVLLASGIFALALAAIAFNLAPAATALVAAALAMVLTGLIRPSEIYAAIDMPVIILLAAMLPVGQALETTGGSDMIAAWLLDVSGNAPPAATLALLMALVMLLSDVVNNAAAAVLAAPVAISLAAGMGASADPFLMAVAVGASCAFLTPIGHQANILVMEPGGYRFGDYWRMGLPLELLILAIGVPLILWVWPLV